MLRNGYVGIEQMLRNGYVRIEQKGLDVLFPHTCYITLWYVIIDSFYYVLDIFTYMYRYVRVRVCDNRMNQLLSADCPEKLTRKSKQS